MRPNRSVSWPKKSAPTQAPATYAAAATPIWPTVIAIPLPFVVSWVATDPTIVTSSPSRIQTVPRPITTIQWNVDHGRRSSRAGMRVSIVSEWSLIALAQYPGRARCIITAPRWVHRLRWRAAVCSGTGTDSPPPGPA